MGTHPGCPISVPLFISQGRLAQLVRAAALHAVGLGFESLVAHFFALFLRLEKSYYSEGDCLRSFSWTFHPMLLYTRLWRMDL